MFDSTQNKKRTGEYDRILFIGLFVTLCLAFMFSAALAQTPTPTPADSDAAWGGYKVTGNVEFGWRWRDLTGNQNKYSSDLNYKQGFRTFDTNIFMQAESGRGKYFDSLLISNSGWGADPSGYTRVNIAKTGIYKFDATVRRVTYFNNLTTYALNEHTQNTNHTFGDFDLSLFPENDKLNFNFGASFGNSTGPGVTTMRMYSDEFPISATWRQQADDFHFGVNGMLAGFNIGFLQGFNIFHDRSDFVTTNNQGNNLNPPSSTNSVINTFSRDFPTDGTGYYSQLSLHRTFAKKFDFTARIIYSSTRSVSSMTELTTGRDNNNNYIDLDRFSISGVAREPHTRGDLGMTYNVTDKFRISNTFSFDQLTGNGNETLYEQLNRRNSAGINPVTLISDPNTAYRFDGYRRFVNTVEGDYQINNSFGFHLGYRYTNQNINEILLDVTCSATALPAVCTPSSTYEHEIEPHNLHALIGGLKFKPVKNWNIFGDFEYGTADSTLTRLNNFKYFNFRARTRFTLKKFGFNASAITKDNTNPTKTTDVPPLNFGAVIKSRVYSTSVDWSPLDQLTLSTGYNYRHQTSFVDIMLNNGATVRGFSEFFVRDHYLYFDITAKPVKRVSLYASYRIDRDFGQGNRLYNPATIQFEINSYPMQFQSPEFRVAFRLTHNIDWNVGYQYYDFHDVQTPTQNYRVHLPYTSLRIYFGNGVADR